MGDVEAPFRLERSAIFGERETTTRFIGWCHDRLRETRGGAPPIMVTYGTFRWVKAAMLLEVNAMKRKREELIAQRPDLPKSILEAINGRVASLENLTEYGILNGLEPKQLLVGSAHAAGTKVEVADDLRAPEPIRVPATRVELLDPELRRRCADLYEQFSGDPADQDRFDTVLREASTVLEERIRRVSGLPAHLHGLDLVSAAFAPDNGELIVSIDRNEQEGAHLLFRGYFGFIRNTVGHHLVAAYTRERAAQVLGYADYLLFLLSQARRRNPPVQVAAPAP